MPLAAPSPNGLKLTATVPQLRAAAIDSEATELPAATAKLTLAIIPAVMRFLIIDQPYGARNSAQTPNGVNVFPQSGTSST
jgi:hypothetical protein